MQGPKTWAELEARLSDRAPAPDERGRDGRAPGSTTTNAPTAAGTYPVVATVTDSNYSGSASGTL
ncbi:MAG: hypothetical protein EBZ93_13250, partial [Actinobacteria bacterium]|nr:hypothetical protein [Actinomycetota bacterium]